MRPKDSDYGNWSDDPIVYSDNHGVHHSPIPQKTEKIYRFVFQPHFHPYVCDFIRALQSDGIEGLMDTRNQQLHDTLPNDDNHTEFAFRYHPNDYVDKPYPHEDIDFTASGAYSIYNWELFFHAPMLIADRLSKSQRFEEAQRWYHFIFNPTTNSNEPSPQRYWKTQPFKNTPQKSIEQMLRLLSAPDNNLTAEEKNDKAELEKLIEQWRSNPFQPHLIARGRPSAYQKNVVMKYLDNLIAWADMLFARDTIEAINEATQLYILASNILGERPRILPKRGTSKSETYASLRTKLDSFSDAIVDLENEFPFSSYQPSGNGSQPVANVLGVGKTLYFCIPQNIKLLSYWDLVADRLYKIRHCMNIEGVVRHLALFEPPIDPALLVKAAASGVDIGSVLSDISSASPYYRFSFMIQKALELCSEVKSFGGILLAALEKRDAEELSMIKSTQESNMLQLIREVKKQQIDESRSTKEGIQLTRAVSDARYNFYANIPRIIPHEQSHMDDLMTANTFNQIGQSISALVSILHLIPNFDLGASGWAGSPVVKVKWGGQNLGNSLKAAQTIINMIAAQYTHEGTMASIKGANDRRWNEWKLQEEIAKRELKQIDKQIATAEIRTQILENELSNHEQQIENAQQTEEYLHTKFTNEELYSWMIGEISAVYFQCYQLAYDAAKKAEKCFRLERGLTNSNFIQFGYWDNLNKGLLAGEKLHLSLRQMEKAYFDQNKREYELTKHISLAQVFPGALVVLKSTGECEIELPELLFDADYPGHYLRRIKNISVSIPCVAGPYTSINCTLTLLSHKTRKDSTLSGGAYEEQEEDSRFIYNFGAVQSIATSNGQNDAGLFELNFRDERYLPFEGAGAISRWKISMPKDTNAIDFTTIADVILHLRFTAREGGNLLGTKAKALKPTSGVRLFSLKHEFPTEWYRFMNPETAGDGNNQLAFALTHDHFPFMTRNRKITFSDITMYVNYVKEPADLGAWLYSTLLPENNAQPAVGQLPAPVSEINMKKYVSKVNNDNLNIPTSKVDLRFRTKKKLGSGDIEDIYFLVNYDLGNLP